MASSPVIAQYVTYSSDGTDVTSITLDYNDLTTINSGDLLMIICGDDVDNSGGTPQFDALTGWTKKGENGDSNSDCQIAVYYKWATGSESGTFNLSHTTTAAALWVYLIRITGSVGSGDPFETFVASTPGVGFTASTSTGTANTDYALYMVALAYDGGDAVLGYSSGDAFTLLTQVYSGTGADDATGRVGYRASANATSFTHVWSQELTYESHAGYGFVISTDPTVYVTSDSDAVSFTEFNSIVNNKTEVTSGFDTVSISKVDSSILQIISIESNLDSISFTEFNSIVNNRREIVSNFDTIIFIEFDTSTNDKVSVTSSVDNITLTEFGSSVSLIPNKRAVSNADEITIIDFNSSIESTRTLISNVVLIQFTTFNTIAQMNFEGIFEIEGQIHFSGGWIVEEV